MEEGGAGGRAADQRLVDRIGRQRRQPRRAVSLPHRHERVGHHHLGPGDRVGRVMGEADPLLAVGDGGEDRVDRMARRGGDGEVEVHQRRRLDQRMADIIAVAAPRPFAADQCAAHFDHGLHVGQYLARVRPVGQPVDHRHGRMVRQFLGFPVVVGADHDRIDIARQDACSVGHRLAAPQLRRGRIEDQRRSPQLPHRHVEADPGAGRMLLEDHRQDVARQRGVGVDLALGPAGAPGFALRRLAQHVRDRLGPGVAEVEEMTQRPASHWPLRAADIWRPPPTGRRRTRGYGFRRSPAAAAPASHCHPPRR